MPLTFVVAAVLAATAPAAAQSTSPTTCRDRCGWTIQADVNDVLDVERNLGPTSAARVAPGRYATAAELCAAIVAALQAADDFPLWECDYGTIIPSRYAILSDFGNAHRLLTGTGANLSTSIWRDIGFDIGKDSTTDVAHVADVESCHGRLCCVAGR